MISDPSSIHFYREPCNEEAKLKIMSRSGDGSEILIKAIHIISRKWKNPLKGLVRVKEVPCRSGRGVGNTACINSVRHNAQSFETNVEPYFTQTSDDVGISYYDRTYIDRPDQGMPSGNFFCDPLFGTWGQFWNHHKLIQLPLRMIKACQKLLKENANE